MLYAIVAMLAIIADQAVKYWVSLNVGTLSTGEKFIPGIISLVNVKNDGAAFSILSGGGARIYFIILTGVFTVAVILALATNFIHGRLGRWSIVMVTAGGLSNCIDRVIYGYVQDMFKVELFDFAVFNLADVFITVFCLLFIIHILFGGEKELEDEYDDEFSEEDDEGDEEEDEEERVSIFARRPSAAKEKKKKSKSKYEDEYEQYKAARAARQQQAAQAPSRAPSGMSSGHPAPQRAPAAPTAPAYRKPAAQPVADPFAEWERANARVGAQESAYIKPAAAVAPVVPAAPIAPAAAPAPKPAAAAEVIPATPQPQAAKKPRSDSDFSIDDILAEFK